MSCYYFYVLLLEECELCAGGEGRHEEGAGLGPTSGCVAEGKAEAAGESADGEAHGSDYVGEGCEASGGEGGYGASAVGGGGPNDVGCFDCMHGGESNFVLRCKIRRQMCHNRAQ